MISAVTMACTELTAEVSLACFLIPPTVGIAISIRMRMMEITISSSIRVKPLGGAEQCTRFLREKEILLFPRFHGIFEECCISRYPFTML
jgi:hypothetical protein